MSEKISKKNLICIIFVSLAGQIAWQVENQYYNVFLYNEIAPVPLYVAIMVAASAIAATITSIIMGAYSDVKGKRRPFLLIGFICWTITTAPGRAPGTAFSVRPTFWSRAKPWSWRGTAPAAKASAYAPKVWAPM